MIYTLPKHFNHNSIDDFLLKFGTTFFKVNKLEPNVTIECGSSRKISVIGVMLLYKWMDFTLKKQCFHEPTIFLNPKDELMESLDRYNFLELMKGIVDKIPAKKEQKIYESLKVRQEDNFIIVPQPMIRGKSLTRDSLHKIYAPQIAQFYRNEKITEMVLTCISEILLNFWKHALDDPQSILVAEGNKSKIEIGCADTGNGIISTLREGKIDFKDLTSKQILQKSIQKNVTSKPNTPHMGRGLWILDEIATVTGGIFHLYSEGVSYKNQNGKKVIDNCGYWKGTIVYLNLPLQNPIAIDGILKETEKSDLKNIKLNII
jgi:hypothetical protein